MYEKGDFDLAGFAVGIAEEDEIDCSKFVREGDVLIALPSSGLHSNGFSLARKVITELGLKFDDKVGLPAPCPGVTPTLRRRFPPQCGFPDQRRPAAGFQHAETSPAHRTAKRRPASRCRRRPSPLKNRIVSEPV